jgi:hypothetical protein
MVICCWSDRRISTIASMMLDTERNMSIDANGDPRTQHLSVLMRNTLLAVHLGGERAVNQRTAQHE